MSDNRTGVFLSVRDKATRLPGKVMRPVHGRPILAHLIDRLKLNIEADIVVMTTSINPGDDGLVDVAAENGIECFRGSEDDKLIRYLDAADKYDLDFAVIVDGDDIFCDSMFIDQVITAWRKSDDDFIICGDLPCGITPYGVKIVSLRKVIDLKAEDDTEVWGGYFTDTGLFECATLDVAPHHRHPDWRMTLDYEEDLSFFKAVFDELYQTGEVFRYDDIVALLTQKPEIVAINLERQKQFEAGIEKARAKMKLKDSSVTGP
jgi:spore coat polysaccharide biosynthesis protein SpsF